MRNLCNVAQLINATRYHCLFNNCYNINSRLCEYLGQIQGMKRLKEREGEVSAASITNGAIIGATALGVMYGFLVGGPIGIGIWGIANTTLYMKNWQKPKKLNTEHTKWFDRSVFETPNDF